MPQHHTARTLCSFMEASSTCFSGRMPHTRTQPSLPPVTKRVPLAVTASVVTCQWLKVAHRGLVATQTTYALKDKLTYALLHL